MEFYFLSIEEKELKMNSVSLQQTAASFHIVLNLSYLKA